MIELNLTYEESKKIFELGYDFSKVCWKSLYEYRDQYNLNRTFIKIHVHGTGLSLTSIEDQIKYQMGKYGIVDLVTPIIPKAALEACLPDKLDIASLDNCVFVKNIDLKTISLFYFFEDYYSCYEEQKEFKSAYKAFIWCHKNYPEELKKKFDEVMG